MRRRWRSRCEKARPREIAQHARGRGLRPGVRRRTIAGCSARAERRRRHAAQRPAAVAQQPHALPYSALEASAVAKAFGSDRHDPAVGIRRHGRERVLQLPSSELAVLHFATHAVARQDSPEQSALYLSEYTPDGALLPDSRLTANDIARSGLRADVVVLSGCATGDGSALRGEGVLGLTYGFLANGSRSVVAALWPIEDASTARFMNEFYRAYRSPAAPPTRCASRSCAPAAAPRPPSGRVSWSGRTNFRDARGQCINQMAALNEEWLMYGKLTIRRKEIRDLDGGGQLCCSGRRWRRRRKPRRTTRWPAGSARNSRSSPRRINDHMPIGGKLTFVFDSEDNVVRVCTRNVDKQRGPGAWTSPRLAA